MRGISLDLREQKTDRNAHAFKPAQFGPLLGCVMHNSCYKFASD